MGDLEPLGKTVVGLLGPSPSSPSDLASTTASFSPEIMLSGALPDKTAAVVTNRFYVPMGRRPTAVLAFGMPGPQEGFSVGQVMLRWSAYLESLRQVSRTSFCCHENIIVMILLPTLFDDNSWNKPIES